MKEQSGMGRMWRGTVKTLVGRTYVVLVLRNTSIARRCFLLGSFLDLLVFSTGFDQNEDLFFLKKNLLTHHSWVFAFSCFSTPPLSLSFPATAKLG